MKTTVLATVPKSTNSYWFGKAKVVSINLETGSVILEMLTGQATGSLGGFPIDKIKFKVVRTAQ